MSCTKKIEALEKLIRDLKQKKDSNWYGEISINFKKGIVETAAYKEKKVYI